jgi:hypothetical protein
MDDAHIRVAQREAELKLSDVAQSVIDEFQKKTGRIVLTIQYDSPGSSNGTRKTKLSLVLRN